MNEPPSSSLPSATGAQSHRHHCAEEEEEVEVIEGERDVEEEEEKEEDLLTMISTVVRWLFLVCFIILTIGGNVMACLAVRLSRRLWRVANCFVVTLAVTDLLLGLLVLPLSAALELRDGKWPLGGILCNIYISMDVFLCTASILTLLAISVDRYLAITAPLNYSRRVTPLRVILALIAIWALSLTVSFVPIHMGWNTADYKVQHRDWGIGDEDSEGRYCQFEWSNNYVVIYAVSTFYLPLLLMCGMYLCIFRVAREQVSVGAEVHHLLFLDGMTADFRQLHISHISSKILLIHLS